MKDLVLKYLGWIGLICFALLVAYIMVNKTSLRSGSGNIDDNFKYKDMYLSSTKEYEKIDYDKIKSIEITSLTENDIPSIVITDTEKIRNIYIMLGNIHIDKETSIKTIDDDIIISIISEYNNTVDFYFNSDSLVIDNTYYKTTGLNKELLFS